MQVLSLEGLQLSLGRVQISTMAVMDDICVAGSFYGDIVCTRVPHNLSGAEKEAGCGSELLFCDRITVDENAITNAIVIWKSRTNSNVQAVISNNDMNVRIMDVETGFREVNKFLMPWSVNYTAMEADGKMTAVVGDATECVLLDVSTGQSIAELDKHQDYSFAAAWHPGGNILATGNQDKTTRIWDIRTMKCLCTLPGKIGAIRLDGFLSLSLSLSHTHTRIHSYTHIHVRPHTQTNTQSCKRPRLFLRGSQGCPARTIYMISIVSPPVPLCPNPLFLIIFSTAGRSASQTTAGI